jgi:hypothetical protein
MSSYTTRCPECRQEIPLPDSYLGKNYRCPRCRTAFDAEHVVYGGKLIPLAELPGGRPANAGPPPEGAGPHARQGAGPPPPAEVVPETPADVRRHARRETLALAGVIIGLVGVAVPYLQASTRATLIVVGALAVGGLAAAVGALLLRRHVVIGAIQLGAGLAVAVFGGGPYSPGRILLYIAAGQLLLVGSATIFGKRRTG